MVVSGTAAHQAGAAASSPQRLLTVGFAFWESKVLLTAVRLGVFTALGEKEMDAAELGEALALAPRGRLDFFDALVAMGFLQREDGRYRNTAETGAFLDRARPSYVGALLEVADAAFYPNWEALPEALRSGRPQHGLDGSDSFLEALRADPERQDAFMRSMTALSQGASAAIASLFPWARYCTFADLGCAQGGLPVMLARTHPHLSGYGFDRPEIGPLFDAYVREHALGDRLGFRGGDFFTDPLPEAEVMVLGHVLHGSSSEQKLTLLGRVFEALPEGGAVIVTDAVIDDERRGNVFGLLMSLNMLVHTAGGFDYTGADCQEWLRRAGFGRSYVQHLAGPDSMVVGVK